MSLHLRLVALTFGLGFAASGTALVACGGDDATLAEGEDDVRIRPDGSDLPGALVLSVPSEGTIERSAFYLSADKKVGLEDELSPLPTGTQTFTLETHGDTFSLRSRFDATIKPGATSTVSLGLLGVDLASGPATFELGGASPVYLRDQGNRDLGAVRGASRGGTLAPLPPGSYLLQFGLFDGVTAVVKAGETTKVTLTDPGDRRVTRLVAPVRELPTVRCLPDDAPAAWHIGHTSLASITGAKVSVESGGELELGIAKLYEGVAYTLRASAWSKPVDVPSGDRGAGPRRWQVGRIDIDDVTVNGTSKVKGTYAVFAADSQGKAIGPNFLRCSPPTNSGVDLPPGRWHVEVSYSTVEAGTKVDVHVVDLPEQ